MIPRCVAHRGVNLGSVQCASHHGDNLLGVQHTAELRASNFEKISSVCNIPGRWFQRCVTHRGDDLRAHCRKNLTGVQHSAEKISYGVQHTVESWPPSFEKISALGNTPHRRYPRCATHCGDKLHTTESKLKSSLVFGCFKRDNMQKYF